MSDPQDSLQLGIAAYKAGDKENALLYLLRAVREHPDNEQAWGWLSNTFSNTKERIHCLRQVLRINPANAGAAKVLKELEGNEWLTAAPRPATAAAPAAPAAVGVSASSTPAPMAVPAETGSTAVQTILVVLLVILVLFWLGVSFLQLAVAFTSTENTFDPLCFGGLNIAFSIVNASVIVPVTKRKKSVLQSLYLLAAFGGIGGAFQLLFSDAYLQACAIPLYILLGILAYACRETFVK